MTAIPIRPIEAPQPTDGGRAARRAERAARKRQAAEQERARRASQFSEAQAARQGLEESQRDIRTKLRRREALSSHLKGFYEEIDKLAQRKVREATDLAVAQVNEIVRDAKEIVDGDPYLDRVTEFATADDNPVYPDVLLVARTVQQSLRRSAKRLEEQDKRVAKLLRECRTIAAALELVGEDGELPSKQEVERSLGGRVVESWFYEDSDGEQYFRLDRLDAVGVAQALAPRF
jgi:hypothetical protein